MERIRIKGTTFFTSMHLLKLEILKIIIKIFFKYLNIDLKVSLMLTQRSHLVLAFLILGAHKNTQASIPLIMNIENY